jgi:hypothetical protein
MLPWHDSVREAPDHQIPSMCRSILNCKSYKSLSSSSSSSSSLALAAFPLVSTLGSLHAVQRDWLRTMLMYWAGARFTDTAELPLLGWHEKADTLVACIYCLLLVCAIMNACLHDPSIIFILTTAYCLLHVISSKLSLADWALWI